MGDMPEYDHDAAGAPAGGGTLAQEIMQSAPRDIIFTMQFLGEAQYKVLKYFQDLVIRELEARGIRREDHALLQIFIDSHATEMRDFVFHGVALARPFRIEEIEQLLGDTTSVIRTDIWDALRTHIETVEHKFVAEADDLPRQLDEIDASATRAAARASGR